MGISVIGGAAGGGGGNEIFETIEHSGGVFDVDCSVSKTAVLDVDDAYFRPSLVAPTFVGGKSFATSLGGTISSYSVSLSSLSGGLASSPSEGDVVIVAATVATDQSKLPAFPSDWTLIATAQQSDTHWTNLRVAYKVMGATPDANLTVTQEAYADFSYGYAVHVWRGVDISNPIDVTPTIFTAQNTANPNPPAITPVTGKSIVLGIGASAFPNTTAQPYSNSASLENFFSSAAQDNNSTVIGIGSLYQETAGITANPGPLGAQYSNSASSYGAVSVALRAALGATNAATINFSNIPLEKKNITINISRGDSEVSDLPLTYQAGIRDFSAPTSLEIGSSLIQEFFTLGNVLYAKAVAGGSKIQKTDFFRESGTWTCPSDVTQIELILAGGGGGGAWGRNNSPRPQGGSGSGSREILTVVPGTVYDIVLGAGGAGANFDANGSSGAASTFGPQGGSALLTVDGGVGGLKNSNSIREGRGNFGGHAGWYYEGAYGYFHVAPGGGYKGRSGAGAGANIPQGAGGGRGSVSAEPATGAGGGRGVSNSAIANSAPGSGGSGYAEIIYWSGE